MENYHEQVSASFSGPVHTYPDKFENAYIYPSLTHRPHKKAVTEN